MSDAPVANTELGGGDGDQTGGSVRGNEGRCGAQESVDDVADHSEPDVESHRWEEDKVWDWEYAETQRAAWVVAFG